MYSKSVRIVAFVILLILLLSTVAMAQSTDSGEGELIELPTVPLPPEEVDTTPIPDAEPVPPEPAPKAKPLEARGEIIVDTDDKGVLDTQIVLSIGAAITAVVLVIGIVGGRSGKKRR